MVKPFIYPFLMIFSLVILAQCTPKEDHLVSPTVQPINLSTAVPSRTTEQNQSGQETIETVSPTGISQPLLEPTYSGKEAESFILSQVENNGNCRLPCLWGLTPGEDRETAEEYFWKFPSITHSEHQIHRDITEDYGMLLYSATNDAGMTQLHFWYSLENEILDQLHFTADFLINQNDEYFENFGHPSLDKLAQYYYPSRILSEYGEPDEIFFQARGLDPVGKMSKESYLIAMYYAEQGFLIQYNGFVNLKTGSNLVICPREMSIYLTTWDPALNPSLEEVTKSGTSLTLMSDYLEIFDTIDEVSSINKDEFYETYRNSDFTECFETPAEYWKR